MKIPRAPGTYFDKASYASTVIRSFSYDKRAKVLQIIFVSGLVYHYKEVPENIYQNLKSAGSKGSYFNQQIKDKYDFERKA